MPFYEFHQNNSGGSFDFDAKRGISTVVIVEATTWRLANKLAEVIGLYFDGSGDCSCCGERWSEQYRDDAGSAVPSVYDTPVETYKPIVKWMRGDRPEVFVHYLNGDVKPFATGPAKVS